MAGLDGLIRLAKADSLTFQVLRSATEYPDEIRDEFGQPDGTLSDLGAVLRYEHQSRNWWWKAEAKSVGREFRADSGFVPQVDIRQGLLGLQRTWWGEKEAWRSRTQWGGDWDYTTDQDGHLIENEVESWASFNGPMQSYVEIDVGWRERVYEGKRFDMAFQHFWGEFRPSGALWLGLGASFGDQLDFANARNGRRIRIAPEFTWRAGTHLRVGLTYLHESLDVDGGRLFTADLPQLRLVYQFNVRTFVRLISQYTDVERDPALYDDEVDARSRDLFNQLLFSYKINPQTVFFLGYSDTFEGFENDEERVDLTRASRTVFVKLGYAWLL